MNTICYICNFISTANFFYFNLKLISIKVFFFSTLPALVLFSTLLISIIVVLWWFINFSQRLLFDI